MRYYFVAGEASGDLHASNLIRAIARRDSSAQFRCFGGDMMKEAGGTLVKHYRELAYMGFWPVVTHLGTILGGAKLCFRDIMEWKPDAVILVDYPGFNLSIAKKVHKQGIPVYYYISPKIWAWKSWRIKNIRRDVDELFSILPFEVEYFRRHSYNIRYVGNPTVDEIEAYRSDSSRKPVLEDDGRRVVALLAGSRRQEISRNLPVMLESIKDIDNIRPVLACAPGIESEFYDSLTGGIEIEKIYGNTFGVLESAYAALVTSGTATLETALFDVPQVVCYRVPAGWAASLFKKMFIKVRFVSLVNLISFSEVVPELLGSDMNAVNVHDHLVPLLSDTTERRMQLDGYIQMKGILGPAGAPDRAAEKIIELLKVKTYQA
ncbi:MAG: lipid-A-disaccharide synthase [Bacteroidaceae bacterium]|nr:lipid-A-disaccharide synthase [Bacteroidaceae bacterium]